MKRKLQLILCGIMAFGLFACSTTSAAANVAFETTLAKTYRAYENSIMAYVELQSVVGVYVDGLTEEKESESVSNVAAIESIPSDSAGDFPVKRYLLVEFKVVEDYYGKATAGAVLQTPVYVYEDLETEIRGFLTAYEEYILYLFDYANSEETLYNADTQAMLATAATSTLRLGDYGLMPVRDDKVSLSPLEAFLNENEISYISRTSIAEWDSFLQDGMSIATAAENIRALPTKPQDSAVPGRSGCSLIPQPKI